MFDNFKEEYTKTEFRIKGIKFYISKIPAMKSVFIFTDILNKIKDTDIDFSSKNDSQAVVGIIKSLLTVLSPEYLEHNLIPKIFDYIRFDLTGAGQQGLNLKQNIDIIESTIDFDDILEILLRGLCVNFLASCLARLSKLKAVS